MHIIILLHISQTLIVMIGIRNQRSLNAKEELCALVMISIRNQRSSNAKEEEVWNFVKNTENCMLKERS